MCGPLYILYRCGDRVLKLETFYCRHATRTKATGERTICDVEWGDIEICDNNNVCNRDDCRLVEKIRGGWRCCTFKHANVDAKTVCAGPITFANGKVGRCWHLICPRCRVLDQDGSDSSEEESEKGNGGLNGSAEGVEVSFLVRGLGAGG